MYITLSKKNAYFSAIILAIILYVFSHSAMAEVECFDTQGNSTSHLTTKIEKPIEISTADLKPGTIIWQSPEITLQLLCRDYQSNVNQGNIFLNFDPTNMISNIPPSLMIYVKYRGADRPIMPKNALFVSRLVGCAPLLCPPEPVIVSFSIVIKATGQALPADGNIHSNGEYALFNVGAKNSNSISSSYNAYLGGLSNIHFVSCKPQINVVANNGNTLDFGPVQSHNAQAGKTEKQIQFSVVANLTNAGQDCQGKAMNVSFSTTNPTNGGDMILPSNDSGFGFSVSPANDQNRFIPLNTSVPLGYVNGSVVKNDFVASLRWLNNSPKIGVSSASANVDVTFK
ncbi:fimbrial protein [Erwinia tasmaniensis]|uniref:Fimbrial protein n=1 Tax=Erwinia tasmaniensis (strain DSM 17950 / CFBP 7177 / CIP 109463 / NCPPB 4357 / Et1/99) TaxID=465817 RepID=B2VH69_ERWT9|nr:fimbrial protein [Erwinia tasmaniensis]CAO95698.1 Fimbrial protein [Erwinia tasmaniensis Et1/99]